MELLFIYTLDRLEYNDPNKVSQLLFKICEEFDIAEQDLLDWLDMQRPEIGDFALDAEFEVLE